MQIDKQFIPRGPNELRPLDPKKKTINVSSSRAVNSLDQLVGAPLKFRFSIGQGYVWKPRESYFRIRASITVGGEMQKQIYHNLIGSSTQDGIEFTSGLLPGTANSTLALAYNAPATLFRSISLRLQDSIVSQTSDVALVDTMLKRIKPQIFNETVTPHLKASFWSRHKAISAAPPIVNEDTLLVHWEHKSEDDEGIPSSSEVELLWSPDVGAFGTETLPPGDWEITLQPETKSAIKAAFVQGLSDTQAEYSVDITDFDYFYTHEESAVPSTGGQTLMLDLIEDRVQFKPIQGPALTHMGYDVEPSLVAVAAAFQTGKALNEVGPKYNKTVFTAPGDDEKEIDFVLPGSNAVQLTQLWMKVGDSEYPPERYNFKLGGGYANQLYVDNMIAQGKILARDSAEGPKAFYELGLYAYWPIQLEAQCGPVQLHHQFAVAPGVNFSDLNLNSLLFTRHRRVVKVDYDKVGRAISVQGAEF